jgi:hypothetical protein
MLAVDENRLGFRLSDDVHKLFDLRFGGGFTSHSDTGALETKALRRSSFFILTFALNPQVDNMRNAKLFQFYETFRRRRCATVNAGSNNGEVWKILWIHLGCLRGHLKKQHYSAVSKWRVSFRRSIRQIASPPSWRSVNPVFERRHPGGSW